MTLHTYTAFPLVRRASFVVLWTAKQRRRMRKPFKQWLCVTRHTSGRPGLELLSSDREVFYATRIGWSLRSLFTRIISTHWGSRRHPTPLPLPTKQRSLI